MELEQIEILKNNVAIVDLIEWDEDGDAQNIEWWSTESQKWCSTLYFDKVTTIKYRIKPQPKYRPFKSTEEMIGALGLDFWVENKHNYVFRLEAFSLSKLQVKFSCNYFMDLDYAYNNYNLYNPITKETKPFGVLDV